MKKGTGESRPLWAGGAEVPTGKPLLRDRSVDVCVVGAGIAGLTTAYLAAREGLQVMVLDDGPIAGGETGRTTAHLSNALDAGYERIELVHGEAGARLAAASHTEAIARIGKTVADEGIDCDLERVDGYLFLPPGGDPSTLDREWEAARRAGLTGVERVGRCPVATFESGAALRFPGQAQLHPVRYLVGLLRALEELGVEIHTGTHVVDVVDGDPARVQAGDVTVTARAAVVATNTPINDRFSIHTKQAGYQTFVIAARVPRGAVTRALYWDTAEDARDIDDHAAPFHYVRLASVDGKSEHEWLVAGGGDHKTGQADDASERFARLEAWTRERFPISGVEHRWSGQILTSVDGLAFIGRNPGEKNVFIATGDTGNGMTHGTIAGLLLADLIQGRENPWTNLYDPARLSLGAVGPYAKENVNVAAQYVDWVLPGDGKEAEDLLPGEAALSRAGGRPIAAYRDEEGVLHERSAVCSHLGCLVRWNSFEKTWDCPCHGSRFDAIGRVVHGPANADLAVVTREEADLKAEVKAGR
jgi:glycine/D-amino acid oxidase-like deaminating enzyme/nitrite reductase/ring-hydroxylating ferredoxin subunit